MCSNLHTSVSVRHTCACDIMSRDTIDSLAGYTVQMLGVDRVSAGELQMSVSLNRVSSSVSQSSSQAECHYVSGYSASTKYQNFITRQCTRVVT